MNSTFLPPVPRHTGSACLPMPNPHAWLGSFYWGMAQTPDIDCPAGRTGTDPSVSMAEPCGRQLVLPTPSPFPDMPALEHSSHPGFALDMTQHYTVLNCWVGLVGGGLPACNFPLLWPRPQALVSASLQTSLGVYFMRDQL